VCPFIGVHSLQETTDVVAIYSECQKTISESQLEGSALSVPWKSFDLGTDDAVPSSASCYLEAFFGRCSKIFGR
jgi:hypothetical protein